jgi:hypothetical protein
MSPTLWRISIHPVLNAHLINLLVLAQVGRQLDHTLLPELRKKSALAKEREGRGKKPVWRTHSAFLRGDLLDDP